MTCSDMRSHGKIPQKQMLSVLVWNQRELSWISSFGIQKIRWFSSKSQFNRSMATDRQLVVSCPNTFSRNLIERWSTKSRFLPQIVSHDSESSLEQPHCRLSPVWPRRPCTCSNELDLFEVVERLEGWCTESHVCKHTLRNAMIVVHPLSQIVYRLVLRKTPLSVSREQ